MNTANSDITNLTKKDVIFCGGANDVTKINSKMALRHIGNFIKLNNHTNIILLSVPHRYDLMQSSCVNNEIRSFSRKLMKSVTAYQHASFLEVVSDRKLVTNNGLHLNGLAEVLLLLPLLLPLLLLPLPLLLQSALQPLVWFWPTQLSLSILTRKVFTECGCQRHVKPPTWRTSD